MKRTNQIFFGDLSQFPGFPRYMDLTIGFAIQNLTCGLKITGLIWTNWP